MTYKLLLATNVFIDALANRKPYAEEAKLILALGLLGEFELWLSATQATDVFYVLSGGGKAGQIPRAKQQIAKLRSFVNICAFTDADIDAALASTWADFEDACVNQAAHKVKPNAVITANVKDFALSDYPVFTCKDFFEWVREKDGVSYREIAFV